MIIKKAFGHITECHAEAVTTIDLDLRDPDSIGKDWGFFLDLDLDFFAIFMLHFFLEKTQSPNREDYEDVPNGPKNTDKNVIQVKEYSPRDDDNDIVFVRMAS